MKYNITAFISMTCFICLGQMPIRDTHIVNQERRDTYYSWGNFDPEPNYFLGIQTNFHYMMTWGIGAPNQNNDYRNGQDIRPYKNGGLGLQTTSNYQFSKEWSDNMKEDAEIIGEEATEELAYNTALTYQADPLYILYYKERLESVEEWDPDNVLNELSILINSEEMEDINLTTSEQSQLILKFQDSGILDKYINDMDILNERFEMSTSLSMGRGKRLISYHEIMIDYRKLISGFKRRLIIHGRMMVHLIRDSQSSINNLNYENGFENIEEIDDAAIMRNIIINSEGIFKM